MVICLFVTIANFGENAMTKLTLAQQFDKTIADWVSEDKQIKEKANKTIRQLRKLIISKSDWDAGDWYGAIMCLLMVLYGDYQAIQTKNSTVPLSAINNTQVLYLEDFHHSQKIPRHEGVFDS